MFFELRQRNKVHYSQLQKIIMHEAFFSTKEFYSNVFFKLFYSFHREKSFNDEVRTHSPFSLS